MFIYYTHYKTFGFVAQENEAELKRQSSRLNAKKNQNDTVVILDAHNSQMHHLSNSVNSVAGRSEEIDIDGDLQERMLIGEEEKDEKDAVSRDKHATLRLK